MARILLLLPTATYRAPDFLAAAAHLGVEVVVGSERRQALAGAMGDRAVVVPMSGGEAAVERIVALHGRTPLDAVVAVDDQGLVVAAAASARLGLRHNPPDAVAATRDKIAMRERLAAGSVPQPRYRVVPPGGDVAAAAATVGYPCVVKPVRLSASQGVIRADDGAGAAAAGERIRAIVGEPAQVLLVEEFVAGAEVAVEALVEGGRLRVLAVFDKPDPLDGPYFEETIYVTPSRMPAPAAAGIEAVVGAAVAALGLREGPVHAELRLGPGLAPAVLEVAARSIGGLCARTLRFGAGISLEEVIIRHALGLPVDDLQRETAAAGVMMLPIRAGGVLEGVDGLDDARAVEGIVGVEISIAPGKPVVPLPEGSRYLGFAFARGGSPAEVERALRKAESRLTVRVASGT